ncbi:MAG: lipoprotein-releasing ABC transporter permease subunit [Pseudomonadota bacterium]
MTALEGVMAWRYLKARRYDGFVSLVTVLAFSGIALGVATLIVVMAVMNGFRVELVKRIVGLQGHIAITDIVPGDEALLSQDLLLVAEVKRVAPLVITQALASNQGRVSGVAVRGMNGGDFADLSFESLTSHGDLLAPDRLAVGYRLAASLDLRLGETVSLYLPSLNRTAFGAIPRSIDLTVGAIFDSGMYEYDQGVVFINLGTAQRLLNLTGQISQLEVFTGDPDGAPALAGQLEAVVAGRGVVRDWTQTHAGFLTVLEVERQVMFVILMLLIVIAAFNIAASMVMLVRDKTRSIAVLMAMGASPGMVARVFFLAGMAVGVGGTAVGFGLGVSFAANIETLRAGLQSLLGVRLFDPKFYFLSQLPAELSWSQVFAVMAVAVILTVISTLYPSLRAARVDPVVTLRNE